MHPQNFASFEDKSFKVDESSSAEVQDPNLANHAPADKVDKENKEVDKTPAVASAVAPAAPASPAPPSARPNAPFRSKISTLFIN